MEQLSLFIFYNFMFGTEKVICPKNSEGWLVGVWDALVWIDPNYFGSLCSNPNKIQTNDMFGGVMYFCQHDFRRIRIFHCTLFDTSSIPTENEMTNLWRAVAPYISSDASFKEDRSHNTCVQPDSRGFIFKGKRKSLDGGVEGEGHHHERRPSRVHTIRNASLSNVQAWNT